MSMKTPAASTPGGLSPDALTRAFAFLDIGDVPSVARVSREWHGVLRTTAAQRPEPPGSQKDEGGRDVGLWLSLIRKYHPTVEIITRALPDDIDDVKSKKKRSSDDDEPLRAAKRPRLTAAALGIPSPSKYWKQQFQRAFMLQRNRHRVKPPKPDPKPLSAYWFQVDLTLCNSKNLLQNNKTRTKVVSRLLDGKNVSFGGHDNNVIDLIFRGGDEMTSFPFDSFGIGITVVDKETGRQATLYAHKQGANIEYSGDPEVDSWNFPHHQTFDYAEGILNDLESNDRYRVGLGCALKVRKGGCDSKYLHSWRYDKTVFDRYGKGLFDQVSPQTLRFFQKCSCDKEWQCYWDLKLEVRLHELFGEDPLPADLAPLEQLRFLEKLDFV